MPSPSGAVEQAMSSTAQAMQQHLSALENAPDAGMAQADPGQRERRRGELLRTLERVYAMTERELLSRVSVALRRHRQRAARRALRDDAGFAPERLVERVAAVRRMGQEIADLADQPVERLRDLYLTHVEPLSPAG